MGLSTALKRLLIMTFTVVSLMACTRASKDGNVQKEVKLGIADIEIICHGDVPSNLSAIIGVSSIFDRSFVSKDTQLTDAGDNRLAGQVEMETPKAIAALMLLDETNRYAVGYVELSQDKPLTIDVTFEDGKVTKSVKSNTDGLNVNPLMISEDDQDMMLSDAAYIIASPGQWSGEGKPEITADDFADSKTALEKLEALRKYIINEALRGREIPATFDGWFLTHLNNMIYGDYYLGYRDSFNTDGKELPIEFFRFLNDIDFSQLLTHDVVTGPNYMMRQMLSSPDLALLPIAEMPVADWQAKTKESLGRVMNDVPQLLLDMLSATSFVEQINNNRPLSDTQIENVKAGYKDDLGKLVLKLNDRLVSDMNNGVNMADLSGEEFILQEYIDTNFKGCPVVVDAWNTWCMPCMEAHKKVEPLRELKESEGVVFLYISDVTSPMNEWQQYAPRIGGEQVRISEASRDVMGETYKLQGFPSYLFFDAGHKLHRTLTAYPGDENFFQYIKDINPQK